MSENETSEDVVPKKAAKCGCKDQSSSESEESEENSEVDLDTSGSKSQNLQPLSYDVIKNNPDDWVVVNYEGEYFLRKVEKLFDTSRSVQVRCLEKPYGIKEPQNSEPECSSVVYEESQLYVCPVKPKPVEVSRHLFKFVY